MTAPHLLSVNVVHELLPDRSGSEDLTAIDKRPVEGLVAVGTLGVAGDQQYDTKHHGGVHQAVYAYAREDALWWQGEVGRELLPGCFGENLTTTGLDVTGAVVGERWRIGSVLLQVRTVRIPCATFQGFWDVPHLVKRFTEHGASGAYLAVLEEGEVAAGDPIDVVDRPDHGVTVGTLFRALTDDRSQAAEALAAAADIPDLERARLEQVAAAASA